MVKAISSWQYGEEIFFGKPIIIILRRWSAFGWLHIIVKELFSIFPFFYIPQEFVWAFKRYNSCTFSCRNLCRKIFRFFPQGIFVHIFLQDFMQVFLCTISCMFSCRNFCRKIFRFFPQEIFLHVFLQEFLHAKFMQDFLHIFT